MTALHRWSAMGIYGDGDTPEEIEWRRCGLDRTPMTDDELTAALLDNENAMPDRTARALAYLRAVKSFQNQEVA